MTNRLPEAGASAAARRREAAARSGLAFVALDPRLRGRFEAIAEGRVLAIDYLVTRPTPGVPTAELSARLVRARPVAP